jgi:hypothetical protein
MIWAIRERIGGPPRSVGAPKTLSKTVEVRLSGSQQADTRMYPARHSRPRRATATLPTTCLACRWLLVLARGPRCGALGTGARSHQERVAACLRRPMPIHIPVEPGGQILIAALGRHTRRAEGIALQIEHLRAIGLRHPPLPEEHMSPSLVAYMTCRSRTRIVDQTERSDCVGLAPSLDKHRDFSSDGKQPWGLGDCQVHHGGGRPATYLSSVQRRSPYALVAAASCAGVSSVDADAPW